MSISTTEDAVGNLPELYICEYEYLSSATGLWEPATTPLFHSKTELQRWLSSSMSAVRTRRNHGVYERTPGGAMYMRLSDERVAELVGGGE